MSGEQPEPTLDELVAMLDAQLHTILSAEQYAIFAAWSERRQRIPDATANAHEMLVLRVVNSDPEVRRLRDAIRAALHS